MINNQLEELKQALLEEKKELENRLEESDSYGLDRSMKDSVGDVSNHDNHPADMGSEMFEREKDFALNHGDEVRLQEVREALERMEEGVYGLCKMCHKEIPYDRLKALPYTQYCIEHAE